MDLTDYVVIEKIIEDWQQSERAIFRVSEADNSIFLSYLNIPFSTFVEKIHPKNIKKKLQGESEELNLFYESTTVKKLPKIRFKITEWTAIDDCSEIKYSYENSRFGRVLIASTKKGICWVSFIENEEKNRIELKEYFSEAIFTMERVKFHQEIIDTLFDTDKRIPDNIKLHLKGSDFQLKVWKALSTIGFGEIVTYKMITEIIKMKNGSRAVGTAIGKNPIAFIIPCHRVVRNSGVIGDFRWGSARKAIFLAWEAN